MNIQLYVENQLCDYDNKSYTSLQKEFISEDELIVTEVEYSYTISIPVTAKNMTIFGFKNAFDVANKFGRVYNAELYADEVLIISGKLKLSEIDKEYFKGNLYIPASVTVSDILGDRMLPDIQEHMKPMNSLSDYTKQNNYVMGNNTTDIPVAKYRDRHVCYPYVLYGLPYNDVDNVIKEGLDFYTQDLKYGNHTITNENIFPAFNVCSLIKDIFATEGYQVEGNIFGDDKFKDLYQTFQYSYGDWVDNREASYYVNFSFNYTNIAFTGSSYTISPTLSVENVWKEERFNTNDNDVWFEGEYKAGVDNPLQTGSGHTKVTIKSNDQHMLKEGEANKDKYVLVIPRSGWYRIHTTGRMKYPIAESNVLGMTGWPWGSGNSGIYQQNDRETVGGLTDEAETTGLSHRPFEFQMKVGTPKDNPRVYSFNGGAPNMPRAYIQHETVKNDPWNYPNYQRIAIPPDIERNHLYGKNGKQLIVKNYTEFDGKSTADFICGARFGGSVANGIYKPQYYGGLPSPNSWASRASLLALPRADKNLTFVDGMYVISEHVTWDTDQAYGDNYEYAARTAQALLKNDYAYHNFDGYNRVDYTNGSWDTSSNYYNNYTHWADSSSAKNYTDSFASTTGNDTGEWTVNEVVWLEKGDTINIELIIPWHKGGHYTCCHSEWILQYTWVNAVMVDADIEMCWINGNKKWTPSASDPIPEFNAISKDRETNVNKLLPQIKCNDYLNNFLRTFNLQLTHPKKNVFSIDYSMMNDVQGNVVSIDELANVDDAEFKSLDLPSTRQLLFKFDKSETGYVHGNPSPYKTENLPWYESGYTGGISVTNDTNTSGTIEKTESNWSYNWYKNIKFINGVGLSVTGAPISVISDKAVWDTESSYGSQEGESPQTNKAYRLFFLSKNVNTSMYNYIEFKYDEKDGRDLNCRLVIPSNSLTTKQTSGNREYLLDYNNEVRDRRKSITDIFFNLYVQSGYQIDVPVKLSNAVYSEIKAGTLIKFNDGLYKAKAIEGHDVTGKDFATMSLLTLK